MNTRTPLATLLRLFAVAIISSLCMVISTGAASAQPSAKRVVILIRHAEKDAAVKGDNPPLTKAGKERAQDFAATVKKIIAETGVQPVQTIYVTNTDRTKQTAAPLAAELKIAPTLISTDVAEATATLKASTASCVYVGHSNTVPQIVQSLTGEEIPPIEDHEHNKLFVLTYEGKRKSLSIEVYGAPSVKPRQ
jgi:phosphohistidine phosphatase SixA